MQVVSEENKLFGQTTNGEGNIRQSRINNLASLAGTGRGINKGQARMGGFDVQCVVKPEEGGICLYCTHKALDDNISALI